MKLITCNPDYVTLQDDNNAAFREVFTAPSRLWFATNAFNGHHLLSASNDRRVYAQPKVVHEPLAGFVCGAHFELHAPEYQYKARSYQFTELRVYGSIDKEPIQAPEGSVWSLLREGATSGICIWNSYNAKEIFAAIRAHIDANARLWPIADTTHVKAYASEQLWVYLRPAAAKQA